MSDPLDPKPGDTIPAAESTADGRFKTLKLFRSASSLPMRSLADAAAIHNNPAVIAAVAGKTHQGQVRADNQDHFLVASLERALLVEDSSLPAEAGTRLTDTPQGRLFIVADGIGGHGGGEVASAVAVDAMAHYAFETMPWVLGRNDCSMDELEAGLRDAMEKAQARIRRVARRKNLNSDLGTTLTMGYLAWPELFLVHVGDSRAYLYRDDKLHRLTRDHTLAQQLVDGNAMSEEEAKSSRLAHVLVNAMGGSSDDLEVELHRMELRLDDQLLFCSDGLYDMVGDTAIEAHLSERERPVDDVVELLVGAANAAGGRDNVTVVLARF
ncbi:MAG: protein phosphatase 2C domain-containing protein [Nannocystaceae bacterium]|nr:protein phosphatase 2C domain-containing protein [Nannocystaceae bacterium]